MNTVMIREKNILVFSIMFVGVLLGDLLYVNALGRNIYPIYYSAFFLLYLSGYMYLVLFSRQQPTFNQILLFFFVLKMYAFVLAMSNDLFVMLDEDAVRFHIPIALYEINSIGDVYNHLFSASSVFNGRLTHVLIFINSHALEFFGFNRFDVKNIVKAMFLFNFMLNVLTLYFVYKASYIYSKSILFARRSVFFLAFNPMFLYSAAAPKKEALLMFALSIFLIFIVSNKKNYLFLVFSLVVVSFERIYMIPLLLGLVAYLSKSVKLFFVLVLGGLGFIESFIGVDTALGMWQNHVVSLTSMDGSYLGNNHGVFSNLLRTMFGPAFIRDFHAEYFNGRLLEFVSSMLMLMFGVVAVKSLSYTKGVLSIIFFTYLFVFLFIPFHSTFKLMILSVFTVIFLDKISFIKYCSLDLTNKSTIKKECNSHKN